MNELELDENLTEYTFDWKNPTAQMLGRWQPWHEGHRELFKRAYNMCGQVCIMIRDVPKDREANSRVPGQDDNPFDFYEAQSMIIEDLLKEGFTIGQQYVIMHVPNIVDIAYGRGVGYTFTEHDLGADLHAISATKIRAELRESGELESKP